MRRVSPDGCGVPTSLRLHCTGERRLTLYANRVKARSERDHFSMRGLLMALLAFDFPGHDLAGRVGASLRSRKTMAKTTTKTV